MRHHDFSKFKKYGYAIFFAIIFGFKFDSFFFELRCFTTYYKTKISNRGRCLRYFHNPYKRRFIYWNSYREHF
jgi:hypothetical protein